ncbi:MAG: hypothetical protein ACI9CE_001632 [Flavobacterium sp.]|jgi:hypothetical protein
MIICGVELTGSDAVISLLGLERGQFNVPECRVRKLTLKKGYSREDLQQFQFVFLKLMQDYDVDKVVIKERLTKGKFAGGAVSFKLESAIQLTTEIDVIMFAPAVIKSTLSGHPLPIPFSDTGLKVFQEAAFNVAYVAHILIQE